MAVSRIAYFLAGAALGAAGAAMAKDGKGTDLLQNMVKGGYGMTEKLLGSVETIKEDIEDYLAEAKFMHEQKAKETAAFQAEEKSTPQKAAPPKKAVRKTPAKKASPKKSAAKKAPVKNTAAIKAPAKKTATKKTAPKKAE